MKLHKIISLSRAENKKNQREINHEEERDGERGGFSPSARSQICAKPVYCPSPNTRLTPVQLLPLAAVYSQVNTCSYYCRSNFFPLRDEKDLSFLAHLGKFSHR